MIYISKWQSDFTISREFYLHETSHLKIKHKKWFLSFQIQVQRCSKLKEMWISHPEIQGKD